MNKGWIDSHAHLVSESLYDNFDEYVQNAIDNNITTINIICGNLDEVKKALAKVENNPMFHLSIGVHPTSVQDVSTDEMEEMMTYLNHPQVIAVGEVGIDYYWDDSTKELQHQRLIEQIRIANEADLPIIVHLRNNPDNSDAVDDLIHILQKHEVNKRGVIHCYTDTVENAKVFLDMGYYLGFGGIMTFKNGGNVRDALAVTPINRILSETDSPYLAPVPKRGKMNQPAYVMYVGKALNDVFGKNMIDQLQDNYSRLFNKVQK